MAGSVETRPSTYSDFHITEEAKAVCLKHKKFLCFQCISDKTCGSSESCEVKDISKLKEDDVLSLYVLIRTEFERKEKLIDAHDEKVLQNKTALEKEINKTYDEFMKRVNEMKDRTLQSLEEQSNSIMETHRRDKDKLLNFKASVSDQSVSEEIKHSFEFSRTLKGIMKTLNDNYTDKKATVTSSFDQTKEVKEFLEGSCKELGIVTFTEEDHYADVEADDKPQNSDISKEHRSSTQTKSKENTNAKPPPVGPRPKKLVGSDEIEDETGKPDKQQRKSIKNAGNKTISGKTNEKDESKDRSSEKKEEKTWSFKNVLKSKPKGKLDKGNDVKPFDKPDDKGIPEQKQITSAITTQSKEAFLDASLSKSSSILPKSLINRSINISELSQMSPSCLFSQLVDLESGKIGMLSPSQNIVAIVNFSGALISKIDVGEHAVRMAKTGQEHFAVVLHNGQCIVRYNASGVNIIETNRINIKESVQDISGFDFEIASEKFAISSPVKVWLINKKGKTKTTVYADPVTKDSSDIYTIYQFPEKVVYSVNASHKTMKCINIATRKAAWKRKFDQLGTPKGVCLYKNTLCVASNVEIAQFSAADGNPMMRYDTTDLITNALGICVIEDVIVVSAESEAKLAFKSW